MKTAHKQAVLAFLGGIGGFIVWLVIGGLAGFGASVVYTAGFGIWAWYYTQPKPPVD
jgi:hypothetical protein